MIDGGNEVKQFNLSVKIQQTKNIIQEQREHFRKRLKYMFYKKKDHDFIL